MLQGNEPNYIIFEIIAHSNATRITCRDAEDNGGDQGIPSIEHEVNSTINLHAPTR